MLRLRFSVLSVLGDSEKQGPGSDTQSAGSSGVRPKPPLSKAERVRNVVPGDGASSPVQPGAGSSARLPIALALLTVPEGMRNSDLHGVLRDPEAMRRDLSAIPPDEVQPSECDGWTSSPGVPIASSAGGAPPTASSAFPLPGRIFDTEARRGQ